MRLFSSVAFCALFLILGDSKLPQVLTKVEIVTTLDGQPLRGSEITIDGELVCETPCTVELSPFAHDIHVFVDGVHQGDDSMTLIRLGHNHRDFRLHLAGGRHPEQIEFPFRSP